MKCTRHISSGSLTTTKNCGNKFGLKEDIAIFRDTEFLVSKSLTKFFVMKALLIAPHKLVPVSFSLTMRSAPPLGLALIAGAIEEKGFDVSVLDCVGEAPDNYFSLEGFEDVAALGIRFDELFQRLLSHYDLIGIGLMFSNNWLINRYLINLLKERYPNALIVAGGEHASGIPEYCLKDCEGLDMVVVGEGEATIGEVAELMQAGKPLYDVPGTVVKVRSENRITTNIRRNRITEVNVVTRPSWHLFPVEKYFAQGIGLGVAKDRSLPMLATRGCPYTCTFCSSPQMWGTKYNMRSVDNVIEEIKSRISQYQITNVDFMDLTAIIKKEWILEFCKKLKRENINITWQLPSGTRTEAIDWEVAVALKDAGCVNITYAPESGSDNILKAVKKKVKLHKILQSIDESYRAGLNVKLNIMMGFPDEKLSDILRTYFFLIKSSYYGATDAAPSMFNPYPGSKLFEELLERKEVELSDRYFYKMVFTQSQHKFANYNRNMGKSTMMILMVIGYFVFYTSNYIFRPVRAFRLFFNVYTGKYNTRGEQMLGTVIKRIRDVNLNKKHKQKQVSVS